MAEETESVLTDTNGNGSRLPQWLRARFSDTQRYFILWVLAGLLCGLAAVAFHKSIDFVFHFVQGTARAMGGGITGYLVLLLAPALGGLLSGIITTKICKEAVGSGIPQTKARYYRNFGIFRLREAAWRFVAGTISVGSGMSLGREGPTVHICAAIASKLGQTFGIAKKRVQAMVPVGMGAGIAAAFNTPLAAMFFVFEELLGDLSTKALFGILVAVVLAAIVERTLMGEHPVFDVTLPTFHTDWWMLLAIPVAIICAGAGYLFVRWLLSMRLRFRQMQRLPGWLKPAIGGLSAGLTGVIVLYLTRESGNGHYGVFGVGYNDLSDALNGRMLALGVLLPLFIGKFGATIVSYASGGSGGLFAPALFLGGLLGAIVGVLGQMLFDFPPEVVGALALLGMGSFFAAVIRCPLTSFMIIFEMTRNYSIMLPLMIGNFVAYILASRWQPVALYDSLLVQDNITLKKMPAYQGEQDWRNLPVKTIMTFEVVTVSGALTAAANLDIVKRDARKHHAYPVLDSRGNMLGMITHHELEETVAAKKTTTVAELVKGQKLISLSPETSIREVARILVMEDKMQAPVVSVKDKTKLLGIVTLHDIARQQNAITEGLGR